MTSSLVLDVDRDGATHVLAMVKLYRRWLEVKHLAVPPHLDLWEAQAHIAATRSQDAPRRATRRGMPQDDTHDRPYLARNDVRRLTGWSLRTIDRRIASGDLPSTLIGRTRRIARADLDRILNAAA